MKFENEIKLALPEGLQPIRKILRAAGFRISKRRVFESNVLFDHPGHSLRKQGKVVRVRRAGSHAVLTYKGPGQPGRHKKRHEIEMEISDPGVLEEILRSIGYRPSFRYDKFRTEYHRPQSTGKIMLDETPVGNYLEIEGNARWIDQTAKALGFSPRDYVTGSYGSLYRAFCHEKGVNPTDMVFKGKRTPEALKTKQP